MVSGSVVHDNSAMSWHDLPPWMTDVAAAWPELPELCLCAARIEDRRAELLPEELPAVARAVEKRVAEFSTGRYLARRALAARGLPVAAIPRADDRQPRWPAGVLGSITHAGDLAIAGIADSAALLGFGIDLEEALRVTGPLHDKLFTGAERERIATADQRLAGLMFSAKEAGYKAVFPRAGRFIGFQEAEVLVDWPARQFRLRYLGDHAPNRIMDHGTGYFGFFERYVLTLFMIP